jgi:glycosyltransferase involved in cell wall biosynthesis
MQEEKLKIVHIIPNLRKGGAERLVQDVCNYIFQNQLAHIKLVTFHKNVDVKFPFHVNIPSQFDLSITNKSKLSIVELQKFIENFKPDIIHSHLWESEMLLTNIKYEDCIRFTHLHDNMVQLKNRLLPNSKSELTNIYEKRLFLKNNYNHFISIAKDSFEFALKSLPKKNRIHLIPNAIDYRNFHFSIKRNYREIRMINIGSFVKKKNQTLAVHILKALIEEGYSASLTFLGDGELKEKVEKLSTRLGINKHTEFLGNVENVQEQLIKSNIYLHTATYEPFGLVLLEAMASGLPVISLNGKGNSDLIENGKNGYIVGEENPNLFSQKIIQIFKNDSEREILIQNGFSTAKKHDIKDYTENLISCYFSAIK